MTKAEERRLYLQQQTSTPTATASATPALSKAEQRRQQLQQAAQPTVVEQPTVTQPVQPITQPTPQSVTQQAQPVVQTVVQPTQSAKEMKKDNFNDFKKVFAEYMTKNKTASVDDMIKLAKDKGLYSGETQYQLDKMKASQKPNTALATTKLAPQTIPNYQNINEMNLKKAVENSPENRFDKNYGEKEAKEEFKQLDFNKSNNAEKYTEYKTELAKAEAENNTRNIAKYSNLLEDYKEAYKEKNEGKDKKYDIVQLESELKKDTDYMNNLLDRYATTQDLNEKQQIASDYKRAEEAKKTRLAEYQDALAYDEIVNKNLARDIVSSFGTNVLGGTANIINAGYSLVQRGSGQDLSTINPKDLYEFVQGKNNLFTGNALLSLATSSLLDKNNKRLSTLLEQIYNRTYQGTQDDLAKELDEIQKEKYQAFKEKYTQDELDAVANQLRHNAAYGSAAFIPNAFGTVGNMVPSILAGVATGGVAEQLGGGAMATAGTVANRAQQVGSMGTLGAGAFSSGLEQALQEGANYNQAFNYGVLSGATEVGTEMLGGEAVNKFLGQQGKTALGKLFGKAIDNLNIESKVGRIIANTVSDVAGESTEEMISEAINPLWKAITYDKDALPKNREEVRKYIKDIFNAGIEAIPSTLLMQGAGIGSNVVKTQQIENGIIRSIQDSDLSQIVKNHLVDEVRKASTDVKLGLEEADYMTDRMWQKNANLAAQSEQMKQRIPQGYSLPQSTIDILAYTENNRPGLNINFDTNIQGNGTFVENADGSRTITLNPNSQRAVEFTLTHELGHDLKGTQEYTQLQNLLEDYAKGKPKYSESLRALEKTYRDSGATFNLKDEATNDMLGQAIGEQEFYNKLAENPTLFNRVTQGLKNLLGNKETKLKNKIEKLTRNAYQSAYKGTRSGISNSLSEKTKSKEFKKDIEDKFKELTGDSILVAGGKLAGVDLRNMQREAGNLGGEMEAYPYSKEALDLFDKYQNSKKSSSYLYHATGIDRLESIIKNGLTTGNKQNQEGVSSDKEIYLSASPELAESYATNNSVTLRIHPKFYDKFENFKNDLLGGEGSYSITNNIPPEMLQIKENNKWINLLDSKIAKEIQNTQPTTDSPDIRYSKTNASWQDFLDQNLNLAQGTKTNFERLPTNKELQEQETKSIAEEPINKITADRPLEEMRNFKKVGDRKVNAYQYENPEVKPFFQFEAKLLLDDLNNSIKGEKWMNEDNEWGGTKRDVVQDIADLLDGEYGVKLKYDEIRNGLEAIIKDNGAENIAAAKRIEMVLDKRLREGYTDSFGYEHDPSDNYKKFLNGEEYVAPEEYLNQQMYERYGNPEDTTSYSLSEKEQKEVNDFADKLFEDKTLDERFITETYQKLNRIKNYSDFEEIKQEVSDYKDKMYKGISGLEDIANLTPEDARQREMRYTQLKDKNTGNQRRFFDNMETSPIIAEDTKNRVNATTYETRHNLDTLEQMKDRLDERGNKLVEEWKMKSKNFTDKDVALGAILIERYQQEGDWDSAARAVEKLADMGTEAGRAVQMYSIFQRLSPETMAIYQQKALNQAFEEMKKHQTGKWVEKNQDKFKLTAEETQFIYDQVEKASQAIDEETKQRELSKIENMINNKLPPEKGTAIKTLRRLAMLFNPKTQVRNIVGNSLIMPVNDVADFIGTGIDRLIAKKTGVRTTSTANLAEKGKGFAKGVKDAVKDYKTKTRTTATGNKYEFEIGAKPFNENTDSKVKNAVNRKLNGLNDLLSAVMSGGDRPFYEAAYRNSLQGQMRANNVTEPTQDMIDIASNEALQRTWNDDNEYTKTVLGIRRALNKINVSGFGLGDLIIPFAKTPANLTKAMVEYSPAGFIESVIDFNDMRKAISRGEMTPQQQKKFVTSMSKAISGTLLYLLGGTLAAASKVRITGSADDDKDVKNFEQNVLGIQPYSVVIGDKSYTYSWANPINAPLAIMADTYKMSKEDASKWDILNNAFKVAGETLVDNSFLSGIKELFSKDSISEGIVDAVESFPESLVPTFLSQIASLGDDTQRQTFEYGNDFKTVTNKIKNKIPALRNTLEPQVNTFGEEIENQNNVFNAFLNPANVREARTTDTQMALYDLYQETKDKTVFPDVAPYSTNTSEGEKKTLTSKDRVTYQKEYGNYISEVYGGLFNQDDAFNNGYKVSVNNNEGKIKILKKVKEDANLKSKEAVGAIDENTNSDLGKLNERNSMLEKADIPLEDYYLMWFAVNNGEDKKNNTKRAAVNDVISVLDHDISSSQKKVLYEIFNVN